jgi:predicted aldo/keto reductase-like oxidoreductase
MDEKNNPVEEPSHENNSNGASQKNENTSITKEEQVKMSRRSALKYMGIGAVGVAAIYCGVRFTPLGNGAKESLEKSKVVSVIKRKDKVSNAEISLLGFGCMRLPLKDMSKKDSIDEKLALEMIDYAYKNGVNYFDTAWFYHQGASEIFVGKALKRYPRESFYLATKMPTPAILGQDPNGLVKSTTPLARVKEIFELQLQRCQTDYIDFFFLHSLKSLEQWNEAYKDTGGMEYLISEKKNGRIKRLGFSFHGPKEELPLIADQYKWDFCMIQNNYYDWDIDGKYLYDNLEQRGIQSISMEPVRGGLLATLNPAAVNVFETAAPDRSIASWAIQWVASLPNVMTVLSGMSTMEQVVDNVKTMAAFKPMSDKEKEIVELALNAYRNTELIPCTECDYCVSPPCPAGIDISEVFRQFNSCAREGNVPDLVLRGVSDRTTPNKDFERQKRVFMAKMKKIPAKREAVRCTNCMECIPKCPQHIKIADRMQYIANLMKELEG